MPFKAVIQPYNVREADEHCAVQNVSSVQCYLWDITLLYAQRRDNVELFKQISDLQVIHPATLSLQDCLIYSPVDAPARDQSCVATGVTTWSRPQASETMLLCSTPCISMDALQLSALKRYVSCRSVGS